MLMLWLFFGLLAAAFCASFFTHNGRAIRRATLIIAFIVLSVTAALIVFSSLRVVRRAEAKASNQPYCIQIADDGSDYRPARSLFDLSVFTMWAARYSGLYMQHHAVLVVDEAACQRLYHWSYLNGDFFAGTLNDRVPGFGTAVTCHVRDKRLPIFAKASSENDYVKFSDADRYSIPKEWQAKWNGGGSRNLVLGTRAPIFSPLPRRLTEYEPGQWFNVRLFINWNTGWILGLMKNEIARSNAEPTTEFGLTRIPRDKTGHTYFVYANDANTNTTIMGCGPQSCQHRFINRGRHFEFSHSREDAHNWRDMQKRIVALMESFRVQPASP